MTTSSLDLEIEPKLRNEFDTNLQSKWQGFVTKVRKYFTFHLIPIIHINCRLNNYLDL